MKLYQRIKGSPHFSLVHVDRYLKVGHCSRSCLVDASLSWVLPWVRLKGPLMARLLAPGWPMSVPGGRREKTPHMFIRSLFTDNLNYNLLELVGRMRLLQAESLIS